MSLRTNRDRIGQSASLEIKQSLMSEGLMASRLALVACAAVAALTQTACGSLRDKNGAAVNAAGLDEDASASGAAAISMGSALAGSSSSSSQVARRSTDPDWVAELKAALSPLPRAMAASLCPTFATTSADCSANGGTLWLRYQACSFLGAGEWNGVKALRSSSGSASCGSFPNPGANGSLVRQFVSAPGSSQPSQATVAIGAATVVVDDASANLANFDGVAIPAIDAGGGYGVRVDFNGSGARVQATVRRRVAMAGAFDHSISGSLAISEASPAAASRLLNGSIAVYHNGMRVVGSSTFTNVQHDLVCCVPVSGTIETTFSAGANVAPTALGAAFVGKTERLTFNGCGLATYQAPNGQTASVRLARCY